jgi:hypothetical protein
MPFLSNPTIQAHGIFPKAQTIPPTAHGIISPVADTIRTTADTIPPTSDLALSPMSHLALRRRQQRPQQPEV